MYTPTPAHIGATHSLSSGTVNCVLGGKKQASSGVSGQAEEHLHQWGLKWLPVKCKGSSAPQCLNQGDMIVWLCFLISLIVKCNGHSRGERELQAMLPIYKMLLQAMFTLLCVLVKIFMVRCEWMMQGLICCQNILASREELPIRVVFWKMIPSPGSG